MKSTCRVAGCRRKPHARGLCQRHYDLERKAAAAPAGKAVAEKAGAPPKKGAAKPVPAPPGAAADADKDGNCTVPGCTQPHHARGYCKSHYGQLRRRGRIEESEPVAQQAEEPAINKDRRLAEIMKRHEILKKEIANIHKELESELDED